MQIKAVNYLGSVGTLLLALFAGGCERKKPSEAPGSQTNNAVADPQTNKTDPNYPQRTLSWRLFPLLKPGMTRAEV
jgi:hypothetical protein